MESSTEIQEAEPLVCENIGKPMPDITGVGILLGFSAQPLISMLLAIWAFFISRLGWLNVDLAEGTAEFESDKRRLDLVSSMLMAGNDIQMLTGAALIITAYTYGKNLDLYHMHLVYDLACFVGVSNCAALVYYKLVTAKNMSRNPELVQQQKKRKGLDRLDGLAPRFRATCVYATLFFILAIMLEVELSKWSLKSEHPGYCYRTEGIASIGSIHPGSDKAYVAVTTIWLLGVMIGTIFGGVSLQKPLLVVGLLPFALHLYFMVALRQANYKHLEGEESENDWDFGQTTASLLLATVVLELWHHSVQYYKFERDLKKYGPEKAILLADAREEETEPGLKTGPVGFVGRSIFSAGRLLAGRRPTRRPRDDPISQASDADP